MDEPNVYVRNRADGKGLEVIGLGHAKVRRVILIGDPLVPPRVFVELLGSDVKLDVAGLLMGSPAARSGKGS